MEGCKLISSFELTVKEILKRNTFQNAKVVAGNNGLNKQIKWTHILETNQFESLINGGELILTTGAGLQLDSPTELTYVNNLIKRKTVGICVELGTHVNHISNEIIQLANKHHYPIIIFEEIVKFVDITQDLHSLIINQHHQILSQLNELSTKFNELSLLPNGILKILQELHACFKQSTLFITDDVRSYYYPPEIKYIEKQIRFYFSGSDIYHVHENIISLHEGNFALVPVKGLGQTWGHLCLQVEVEDNILNEFLFSVMDRAALAIAQIMLRNRTIEERKQNIEDKLVRNLLQGKEYDSDELQSILPFSAKSLYYRLILIQLNHTETNPEEDWNEIKLQQSMMFRSLFKHHGYFPAISISKNDIAIISFFRQKDSLVTDTSKFSQIVQSIIEIREKNMFDGSGCIFGISKVNKNICELTTSYQEAKKILFLQGSNISSSIFYEHIGVYRLLLLQHNAGQLDLYIHDYLGPVLNYDLEMKSELFKTLEVYLDCQGSKKEAAEQLFIVRQTLYHRLRKIEELLGKDFMKSNNRLALEIAIKAYYISKAAPSYL